MEESVRIPKERVGAVIGKNGQTKKDLEKHTGTRLKVDSESGEITIKGTEKNPIGFYNSLNIIKAIGRGFSPERAFMLTQENYMLEIIDIKDELNATDKELEQKKGRIIGTNGKTRNEIESKTDCAIAVYGKTVSIIGEADKMHTAKKAIDMLLSGATHSKVYGFLNKKQSFETFEI
ncbi:MAG: RNA-processing protein [Candidatus Diapherotrites archaeon]|uniref:RNA-processing protein n=1 Tax=Candidatus Iainarchaeum sp. TaxID=3101447 RepID=A0A8T4L5P6_9ARCH|nr:RNA-processing protein [Candidatus Diapherotrites archaeon]